MSESGIEYMEKEMSSLSEKLSGILKFKEGKEERRRTLNKLVSNIERSQSVDFVFLVDITGTMQRHIDLIAENCVKISKIVKLAFRGFKMRCSFIGYRDFYAKRGVEETKEKRFEILPLGDVERLPVFLREIKASGGGDIAEDVFGGLKRVQELDFDVEHPTRLLFHLADAPCHGKEYHDLSGPEADYYPGGDPLKRDVRDLLGFLADWTIHYFFVQIRDPITSKYTTMKMLMKFGKIYEEAGKSKKLKLMVFNQDQDYLSLFIRSVHQSMSATMNYDRYIAMLELDEQEKKKEEERKKAKPEPKVDSSVMEEVLEFLRDEENEDGEGEEAEEGEALLELRKEEDASLRNWTPFQPVRFLKIKNINSLTAKTAKKFEPEYEYEDRELSFQNPAFASGVFRFAYMTKERGGDGSELLVGKIFKKPNSWGKEGIEYKREALVQVFACRLAEEFNQEMEKLNINERVRFLPVNIVELKNAKSDQDRFLSVEPFLGNSVEFEKFNNNAGMVSLSMSDDGEILDPWSVPQAFSHFTFEKTKRFMIVVDIQGTRENVVGTIWYKFTDPLAHSEKDMMKYPESERKFGLDGNFGNEGVKMFFGNHTCNSVCKALKLKERKIKKKK